MFIAACVALTVNAARHATVECADGLLSLSPEQHALVGQNMSPTMAKMMTKAMLRAVLAKSLSLGTWRVMVPVRLGRWTAVS